MPQTACFCCGERKTLVAKNWRVPKNGGVSTWSSTLFTIFWKPYGRFLCPTLSHLHFGIIDTIPSHLHLDHFRFNPYGPMVTWASSNLGHPQTVRSNQNMGPSENEDWIFTINLWQFHWGKRCLGPGLYWNSGRASCQLWGSMIL